LPGTAAPADPVVGVEAVADLVVRSDTGIRGPEGA
jgi:hypothetical protein